MGGSSSARGGEGDACKGVWAMGDETTARGANTGSHPVLMGIRKKRVATLAVESSVATLAPGPRKR